MSRQTGDKQSEGKSFISIANIYSNLGQYQKAIDYYQNALTVLKQVSNRDSNKSPINKLGLGVSYFALGSIYAKLGQYQEMINYLQQDLIIRKEIGDFKGEGISINALGIAYNALGQYQKAIDYCQKALKIAKQVGNLEEEGFALNNLGFAFYRLNQIERAALSYKQSVNSYEIVRQRLPKKEQRSYLKTVEYTYRDFATLLLKQGKKLEAQKILDLLKIQ